MLVNRQNPRRAFRRCSRIAYNRTFDAFRRAQETAVVVTNVRHSAKIRLYDSEDRVCGYALTNAAGRGVSVSLAYDGSYVTNTVYTLPNGNCFSARLSREAGRRNLVTRRDYFFGGQSIYWYSTEYDLLNRPTNATDSVSLVREWLYNRRSELAAATVGADSYGYAYDSIGNRLWSAANAVTNSYTANSLNQYTAVSSGANPVYDADGNMTGDGTFAYAYDAENRLVLVTSAAETNGAIRVLNAYDHRNRRIRKTVQRLNSSIAPPPSPPVGIHEWETQETHTFVWDDNNIVLEKVEFANGTTRTLEYFWGADKSGTEQGAGGVEGLLAVSIDGVFYIPCYDHNGNIILYVSETGSIAAQYTYDLYGNIIESSGPLADVFSFGFSTQYHDRDTGMVGYKRRFYRPDLGRWLNRDPIEEEGGENLYAFCLNNAIINYDKDGCAYFAIRGLGGGPIIKWSWFFTCPFMKVAVDLAVDALNVELVHEQLFFEDGGDLSSIGWGKDENGNADYLRNESSQRYTKRDGGYDDCIMRIAVGEVNPDHYQLTWIGANKKCNCQDYASALRAKYRELSNDPKVKCKCKKGK